ncbi:MAG: hypothetical protein K0R19_2572 [Bacillota bacterium]|nr:hypothetical protein [Bacillota bacterium]
MDQREAFDRIKDRFARTALVSVQAYREGNDVLGLAAFLSSMDDLEQLFELNWRSDMSESALPGIVPILRELKNRIKNQDIAGITDLMEFVLCPAVKELGCSNGNEDRLSG